MKRIREFLRRLIDRRDARQHSPISIDDPSLQVVVRSFDETAAASAVLAGAADWQPERPAVLRHHLLLPDQQVEPARDVLAQDHWTLRPGAGAGDADQAAVVALRVQQLDALHCSQESSRMAGLAQRLGGHALGWDALQPSGTGD